MRKHWQFVHKHLLSSQVDVYFDYVTCGVLSNCIKKIWIKTIMNIVTEELFSIKVIL